LPQSSFCSRKRYKRLSQPEQPHSCGEYTQPDLSMTQPESQSDGW
jgi:hypothetical protein